MVLSNLLRMRRLYLGVFLLFVIQVIYFILMHIDVRFRVVYPTSAATLSKTNGQRHIKFAPSQSRNGNGVLSYVKNSNQDYVPSEGKHYEFVKDYSKGLGRLHGLHNRTKTVETDLANRLQRFHRVLAPIGLKGRKNDRRVELPNSDDIATNQSLRNKDTASDVNKVAFPPPLPTPRPRTCNHCFQPTFSYVINPTNICHHHAEDSILVLVMVFSEHSHSNKRSVIRETWGSVTYKNIGVVRLVFVLGDIENTGEKAETQQESAQYGDILMGDFKDSYRNLTLKTVMSLGWANRYCSSAKYYMKIDDDMWVNIPMLLSIVSGYSLDRAVGGMCTQKQSRPVRKDGEHGKYRVTQLEYPQEFYPPLCNGTAYVMSMQTANDIYWVHPNVPFFHLEHVYVALCRDYLAYGVVPLPGFHNTKAPYSICYYRTKVVTSHRVTESEMREAWTKECFIEPKDPIAEFLTTYPQDIGKTKNISNPTSTNTNERLIKRLHANRKHCLPLCPFFPKGLVGAVHIDLTVPGLQSLEKMFKNLGSGGHYKPPDCQSRHKVALVVPYRDREMHLKIFLSNIHPFLQRQQLEYRIYVVEQSGNNRFNKAILMNIGFTEAMKQDNYDCFVFHDVDLLPEDDRTVYSCPEQPRHLSAAVDRYGYKALYSWLFGGATQFRTDHFRLVNGFSNKYWGWGGEDDDMYKRLVESGLRVMRYPLSIARYKSIRHARDKLNPKNPQRRKLVKEATKRYKQDGLNNLTYDSLKLEQKKLYTWIYAHLP